MLYWYKKKYQIKLQNVTSKVQSNDYLAKMPTNLITDDRYIAFKTTTKPQQQLHIYVFYHRHRSIFRQSSGKKEKKKQKKNKKYYY